MNSHPKNGTEKKINQRLFKRLILYYNVEVTTTGCGDKIFTKADSAPSVPLMTVGWLFTRRPGPAASA